MRGWFSSLESVRGVLALAGVLIAALGNLVHLNAIGSVGVALLGAALVFLGMGGVVSGQVSFRRRHSRVRETYSGIAGRAWGVLLGVMGFGIMGLGILSLLNPATPFPSAPVPFSRPERASV